MWQAVLPESLSTMKCFANRIPGKLLQMKPKLLYIAVHRKIQR
jgi:hypothetical protein